MNQGVIALEKAFQLEMPTLEPLESVWSDTAHSVGRLFGYGEDILQKSSCANPSMIVLEL